MSSVGRVVPPWRVGGADRRGAGGNGQGVRRTMPTGGGGPPIGGWPSGAQVEAARGTWTVRPLRGAPQGVGEADEGGKDGAPFSCQTAAQSTA